MISGYITNIDNYKVQKHEIPRPGGKPFYKVESSGILVLHTTESDHINGAVASLNGDHFAPTFVVGENMIIQTRPIGIQGAALHDPANRRAEIQIEVVGRSKQTPWMFDKPSLDPLVSVLGWCNKNLGIPLRVPCDWPEDYSDLRGTIWASKNKRRIQAEAGAWEKEKGIWMHMECPWQGPSYHWDCGALPRRTLIAMVNGEQK
jgi:hypothetical protein